MTMCPCDGIPPDPYLVSIVAGGDSAASEELGAACTGNVTSKQPDVALNYTAGSSFGLYLYAEAAEDTTLIVLGPDGWHCDDDSHGDLNPGVTFDGPSSGDYLIWVGTYGVALWMQSSASRKRSSATHQMRSPPRAVPTPSTFRLTGCLRMSL